MSVWLNFMKVNAQITSQNDDFIIINMLINLQFHRSPRGRFIWDGGAKLPPHNSLLYKTIVWPAHVNPTYFVNVDEFSKPIGL